MERKLRILSFVALGFMIVFVGFLFASTFTFARTPLGWSILGVTIGTGAIGLTLFLVVRGIKRKIEKQRILEQQEELGEAFDEKGNKIAKEPPKPRTKKEIDEDIYDLKTLD